MSKQSARGRLPHIGCAAMALLWAPAGFAQDAASVDDGSDIIVTAQRRAERLEDVPMAITAITPDAADSRGVRNLQDLTQAIAGVQINFQGSFTFPAVRGITSLTTGFGYENNVGVYIDGFYQPDSTAINAEFANLASIQVLKGPQGSLYGRNATGGAILIETKRPAEELTGAIDLRYGSFNDMSASGFISGPVAEGLRFSLAGYARQTDGYYDKLDASGVKVSDKGARGHTLSGRAKLEADLAPDLVATLGFNFIEFRDDRGGMFVPESERGATIPVKQGRLYDPRTVGSNDDASFVMRVKEPTLKLVLETGLGTITSNTGYAWRFVHNFYDFDGSWADLTTLDTYVRQRTFQQNLDFNVTAIEGLDLVVGGSYYKDRSRIAPLDTFSGGKLVLRTDTLHRVEAAAAFVDGTWHVTNRFSIGFGGRYTTEKRGNYLDSKSISAATGLVTANPKGGDAVRFNNFSPRGVLTYELAGRTNVYASISRGFRSGLVQSIAVSGVVRAFEIRPETITAYEVGFKTARPGLRFDAAAFYYDYSNIQVGLTLANPICAGQPGCGPITVIANAPKAEVYGVEAQLDWEATENLKFNVSSAYLHAEYTDFPNVTSVGLDAANGRNVGGQVQDWTGQQMARAPSFTAALAAEYTVQGVFGGRAALAGNFKYTTSYVPNTPALFGPLGPAGRATDQRYRQGAYATVNASINWTDPSDSYTLGLWVNNLTDIDYRLSLNGSANGTYGIWNQPRQWGARLGARW